MHYSSPGEHSSYEEGSFFATVFSESWFDFRSGPTSDKLIIMVNKIISAVCLELLDDLFQKAREKVTDVAGGDAKKYGDVLKGLVLEGLYILNEEKVAVRGRKKDSDAIKKAIEEAAAEFKNTVKEDTAAELEEDEPLPDES